MSHRHPPTSRRPIAGSFRQISCVLGTLPEGWLGTRRWDLFPSHSLFRREPPFCVSLLHCVGRNKRKKLKATKFRVCAATLGTYCVGSGEEWIPASALVLPQTASCGLRTGLAPGRGPRRGTSSPFDPSTTPGRSRRDCKRTSHEEPLLLLLLLLSYPISRPRRMWVGQ